MSLSDAFTAHIYVRITRDRLRVRHVESGAEKIVEPLRPFTTTRMLVGDFTAAEHAMKSALRDASKARVLPVRMRVLIHPLEKIEGGLCEIEERILRELALGAGASKAVVWVGRELGDDEVKRELAKKPRSGKAVVPPSTSQPPNNDWDRAPLSLYFKEVMLRTWSGLIWFAASIAYLVTFAAQWIWTGDWSAGAIFLASPFVLFFLYVFLRPSSHGEGGMIGNILLLVAALYPFYRLL